VMFVHRSAVTELDMSLEDAARLVISGGLITSDPAAPSGSSATAAPAPRPTPAPSPSRAG
jgi:uncharacterized membrane protein